MFLYLLAESQRSSPTSTHRCSSWRQVSSSSPAPPVSDQWLQTENMGSLFNFSFEPAGMIPNEMIPYNVLQSIIFNNLVGCTLLYLLHTTVPCQKGDTDRLLLFPSITFNTLQTIAFQPCCNVKMMILIF
jgi:hypothetical protein